MKNNNQIAIKYLVLMIFGILLITYSYAQNNDSEKVYKMNYWIDVPLSAALSYTNYLGLEKVYAKPGLDSVSITQLRSEDINWFDRPATKQNPGFMDKANTISDYGFGISFALPFFLFIDNNIRNNWGDIALLYLETICFSSNIYAWGGANNFDRNRPLMYNPDVDFDMKMEEKMNISFYSGHVSTVATATFFSAKVLLDYHPEWERKKKYLIYSVAAVPPAIVGYLRFRAAKHFASDIITGYIIGTGVGILIPHLHLNKDRKITFIPISGAYNGLCMSVKF